MEVPEDLCAVLEGDMVWPELVIVVERATLDVKLDVASILAKEMVVEEVAVTE